MDEDHIGTTGYHPNGWPVGETPPNGLCAAAAAFPATQSEVLDNLDQLHRLRLAVRRRGRRQRRLLRRARAVLDENSNDCDALGPDAYNAPGMEGRQ